ncbi:MAG: Hpt domain-containing protein, partial [Gammaproteobacteria bacterium]|nr:Hpt domain-containing protein [Gammaproteobacteria bacterium]
TEQKDELPELPGIDTGAGLATTMDNPKLYRKLLGKFRDSQADFAAQFAAAQKDVDETATTRTAHTLKGVAGNIGAKQVQAAAERLELACKEGAAQGEIDNLLAATVAALHPLLKGLEALDTTVAVARSERKEADPAKVQELIVKLRSLLEDGDSDAAELLEELSQLTTGTALAKRLDEVATAVADYDFETAAQILNKILAAERA